MGDILPTTFNVTAELGFDAFSFGTSSCNIGDFKLQWDAFPAVTHPAIQQGLFKLKNGRFEQIGVSWLKHGFTALNENICGCGCEPPGNQVLGVGCSDPYTASRNASQSSIKPRYYVNAHTGVFPSSQPVAGGSGTTYRRLRVSTADLEPSSGSVRYFAECQYVAQDDAYFNNNDNNSSYREMSMSGGGGEFTVGTTGAQTQREQPGIRAWKDVDSLVIETDVQVSEPVPTSNGDQTSACAVAVSAGGFGGPCPPSINNNSLVIVASRATSLGGAPPMWHYEYAVQNVNCDTSIGSFVVPLPDSTTVTNIGFHDVDHHSGDGISNLNQDGTDWAGSAVSGAGTVSWATAQPFGANPNGNAIRWGTMYNFRFDANKPPSRTILGGGATNATVGTFKTAGSYSALVVAPDNDCNNNGIGDGIDLFNGTLHDVNGNEIPDECEVPPTPCPGDVALPHNGFVNVDDLLAVINSWGPCAGCPGDIAPPPSGDGFVNVDDLLGVINAWGPCPP